MRPLVLALALSPILMPAAALARDTSSIIRGSLLDGVVEFRSDRTGRDADPAAPSEDTPATTNPTRPDNDEDNGDASLEERPATTRDETDEDDAADADDASPSFDAALRGGYDSNPDEEADGKGSAFAELEVNGEAAGEIDGRTKAFLSGSASLEKLFDAEFENRVDATLAAAVRREVTPDLALQGGIDFEVDSTDQPATLSGAAAIGAEWVQPWAAFSGRASLDAERATELNGEADEDDLSYDFYRPALEGTALVLPDGNWSPFVNAGISRIEFTRLGLAAEEDGEEELDDETGEEDEVGEEEEETVEEAPGDLLDRDANQQTIAIGLRGTVGDDLVIKLAGRATRRDFDAAGASTLLVYSPELEIVWAAADDLSVTASFLRTIGEPDETGSLAQDVKAFEIGVASTPDTGFGYEVTGSFEDANEIGVASGYKDYGVELTGSYRFTGGASAELGLLQTWSFGDDGEDDYTRTKISAGAAYSL